MTNNRILISYVFLLAFLPGMGGLSVSAFAQQAPFVTEKSAESVPSSALDQGLDQAPPPPEAAPPAASGAVSGGPLTVTDVIIDKTDKNAVVARDQAIIEAQRTAFETVAEKSMSPDAFKAYKVPDSKTIAALVDSFEIKNEQMTSDRYVGNFTVRFLPDINNYIKIPEGLGTVITAAPPVAAPTTAQVPAPAATAVPASATSAPATAAVATPAAPAAAAMPAAPRNILILPYYEDASGRKVLWDDPNPWRDAWQAAGSSMPGPNLTVSVPMGDLTDVSSGNTDAVWKNDFSTVEKSRVNYNATEVALAVAHAGKDGKDIDLYIYKDGKLEREKSIGGKYSDPASYKKAIAKVIAALRAPQLFAGPAPGAAPPATTALAPAATEKPAAEAEQAAAGKVTVDATMNFDNYAQWMEAQKRLASLSPPVEIDISSLTKDQAQFTLDYDGGGLAAFKTALAGKGLALGSPVTDVGVSALGSDQSTQKTIYELTLRN